MVIAVSPDEPRPTHHISLSRAGVEIGLVLCDGSGTANPRAFHRSPMPRNALKTYSGEQRHGDSLPPWTEVAQQDWHNGLGLEDFDLDSSSYSDGWRVDSTKERKIFLGAQTCLSSGYRSQAYHWPYRRGTGGIVYQWAAVGDAKYGMTFAAPATLSTVYAWLTVRRVGTPNVLTVSICEDDGGEPGTVLGSATVAPASVDGRVSQDVRLTITAEITAAAATWITVESVEVNAANQWDVLCDNYYRAGYVDTGAGWGQSDSALFYRVTDADKPFRAFFAEIDSALIAGLAYDDGTVSKVYLAGARGKPTSATDTTLVHTASGWTVDEFAGCIVRLLKGAPARTPTPYRTILSNTADTLTIDRAWDENPTSDTDYVIVGGDRWTEITGHSFAGTITDMCVINRLVYFAMGDGEDMERLRFYTGAWDWDTETDSKYSHAKVLLGEDNKVFASTRGPVATVAFADAVDGTAGSPAGLTFSTGLKPGDWGAQATGMIAYGTPLNMWIFKEESPYNYNLESEVWEKLNLVEMEAVRDLRNGAASLHHNVYLYFSVQRTWQMYSDGRLDNVGPESRDGLPADRQGHVAHAVGYAGRYYIGIDAGTGTSSVLCHSGSNDGSGWHEVWRAPQPNMSVRRLHIQTIPGDAADRLWISCGSDIFYVPIQINPLAPANDLYQQYSFAHEGHLITSKFYLGLQDVPKLFNALKLVAERVNYLSSTPLAVDYRVDDNANWTYLSTVDGLYSDRVEISPLADVAGNCIQFRIRLSTTHNRLTPRLIASVLEAVTRVPYKYTVAIQFRMGDKENNLRGDREELTVENKQDYLKAWSEAAGTLTVKAVSGLFHSKRAFLEPNSIKVLAHIDQEGRDFLVCQATLVEI